MEGFRIDATWLDALDRYVEGLQADVLDSVVETQEFVRSAVISSAKQRPAWVNMADNISVWSDDNRRLVIGVNDDEFVSQAVAVEYGDLTNPPDSLFRSLDGIANQARDRLRENLASRRPVVIKGVKL